MNRAVALQMRYQLIPEVASSSRAKRSLEILIARTSLNVAQAVQLVDVQLAKWYCEDLAGEIRLDFSMYVPENATTLRGVLDEFGVEYGLVPALEESDSDAIAELALAIGCDLVVSREVDALREVLNDNLTILSNDPAAVLHAVEVHFRGFDVPWSFEWPAKNQPWSNFYTLSEETLFAPLRRQWESSTRANPKVAEVMRSLVADALPAMCFDRDRLEFYRQQDRWAERVGLERQSFRFESIPVLNHFYLALVGAVDQVAALVVHFYDLKVDEKDIGAITAAFRSARKAVPGVAKVFSDRDFWKMYSIPQRIRHKAAHRGPIAPQVVFSGDDDFTDDQLDAEAEKRGYFDDMRVLERIPRVPPMVLEQAIALARIKAKMKLLGPPLKHVLFVDNGKKGLLMYSPDPASDVQRFVAFLHRVLALLGPWENCPNKSTERAAIT